MFGIRPDGRKVTKGIDPITRITPFIMTERSDAQCYCLQYANCDIIGDYVKKKRAEGIKMSQMSVVLAAYLRMVSEMPEMNRFVVGKTVYARNEFCVSFAMVKVSGKNDFLETTVKIYFDPSETIFDVARKVEETIDKNREVSNSNATDKIANTLLAIPGLMGFVVAVLKGLDKIGLMPKAIVDASPFHTSMFITNMASIKMNYLYHHLYNFGTTTVFLGLGKKMSRLKVGADKKLSHEDVYPIAVTTDERIAPGAVYSMAFKSFNRYLENPELLETPPETVRYDGLEYHLKEEKKH